MIDDKDVKKLIGAFKEIFPTAEMVQEGFDDISSRMATKEQFEKLEQKLDAHILKNDEEVKSVRDRVKVVENALEIE